MLELVRERLVSLRGTPVSVYRRQKEQQLIAYINTTDTNYHTPAMIATLQSRSSECVSKFDIVNISQKMYVLQASYDITT